MKYSPYLIEVLQELFRAANQAHTDAIDGEEPRRIRASLASVQVRLDTARHILLDIT